MQVQGAVLSIVVHPFCSIEANKFFSNRSDIRGELVVDPALSLCKAWCLGDDSLSALYSVHFFSLDVSLIVWLV